MDGGKNVARNFGAMPNATPTKSQTMSNHIPKRPLETIDLVSPSKDDIDKENDTSEPRNPKRAMTEKVSKTATPMEDDDDSPELLSTTMPNPNVDYSHRRIDCGVHPWKDNASLFCSKCYCAICDKPASQCSQWAEHCQQTPTVGKKQETDSLEEVVANYMPQDAATPQAYMQLLEKVVANYVPHASRDHNGNRPASITEVLEKNLRHVVQGVDGLHLESNLPEWMMDSAEVPPMISKLKMEGDVGQLRLHNSFFVEGVKIGWPFPKILTPQRQMAMHIVRALKHKRHVILESPTGTGKSAAILCSALAWQRYNAQRQLSNTETNAIGDESEEEDDRDIGERVEREVPTIIYCSRTHSQVTQMVASLKKTPYRPRITVLGSRNRLCINRNVLDGPASAINSSCRERKNEIEKRRKAANTQARRRGDYCYDDNNPPRYPDEPTASHSDDEDALDVTGNRSSSTPRRKQKPTCRYYQQLSTSRSAEAIQERFLLSADKINNCSAGGEQTSLGVMDIEDMVQFGKNPNNRAGEEKVSLYRESGEGPFGLILGPRAGGGCEIQSMKPNGVAANDGRLQTEDWIVAVNGISTRTWQMEKVKAKLSAVQKDPLILTVRRQDQTESEESDNYSDHAICPYYISRALMKQAHLVFAPYNYVLDPSIRRTMHIDLVGSILVLDEAHNVEDTLCESGSGQFSEVDLCQLIVVLSNYANQKPRGPKADEEEAAETRPVWAVAHDLLLFLESLILYLREERLRFEAGPGLNKIKEQHSRTPISDEHSIELNYHGPSGFGIRGEAVGCAAMMKKLGLDDARCTTMKESAQALESHLFGGENEKDDNDDEVVFNDLIGIVELFHMAATNPEHFYLSTTISPNGNMDYATEMNPTEYDELMSRQRWRRHPRVIPFVSPRTETVPLVPIPPCSHKGCQPPDDNPSNKIRHGEYCNGTRPRWEAHLNLRLLSPGLLMDDLLQECRTVILASGSLAPIPSLAAELNLLTPHQKANSGSQETVKDNDNKESTTKRPSPEKGGRLQCTPPALEAGHVVDLKKQLFACAIGKFPDGSPLTVSYSHYSRPEFFPKLGHVIAKVVESIPSGGVLIFFPSYSFLKKCVNCWNPSPNQRINDTHCPEIWRRLVHSKGHIIVEPTGDQEKFVAACEEYRQQIKDHRQCILLAVFRGKMSEGISFNDDNARAVLCVGVPYPNSFDRRVKAKKAYNDEQRRIRKNTHLLPGAEWYSQQAFRAIAQALGRCIRHGADYGSVILLDSRHCDDGSPNDGLCRAHKKLPKWMRTQVRTLSLHPRQGVGHSPILNGFEGLQNELRVFFQQARSHGQSVERKWELDREQAEQKSQDFNNHVFDKGSGRWVSSQDSGS